MSCVTTLWKETEGVKKSINWDTKTVLLKGLFLPLLLVLICLISKFAKVILWAFLHLTMLSILILLKICETRKRDNKN